MYAMNVDPKMWCFTWTCAAWTLSCNCQSCRCSWVFVCCVRPPCGHACARVARRTNKVPHCHSHVMRARALQSDPKETPNRNFTGDHERSPTPGQQPNNVSSSKTWDNTTATEGRPRSNVTNVYSSTTPTVRCTQVNLKRIEVWSTLLPVSR